MNNEAVTTQKSPAPEAQKAYPVSRTIVVDKIGSSTGGTGLDNSVVVSDEIDATVGNVLVVRALREKSRYNQLELVSGRMAKINVNDVIAGALGFRSALKGFVGDVPRKIKTGDVLHVLNLGGVIGRCTSQHRDLGRPLEVEVLGMAVRDGKPVNIKDGALPPEDKLVSTAPLVMVAGTCMNSGKTTVAAELIRRFTQFGHRVAGAKLSGVACLRDTLNMEDHGARRTLSFLDCGLPSTVKVPDLAPYSKAIINRLMGAEPSVIILELGDGIIGGYQVPTILADAELMARTACVVMCANDLVGAWGAKALMEQKGLRIDIVSGPVTDNEVGTNYIEKELRLPAANAMEAGEKMFNVVCDRVNAWLKSSSLEGLATAGRSSSGSSSSTPASK